MSATFVAAGSLEEALDACASGARPIAGGTDLVVGARSGAKPMPDALVAIHALDELRAFSAGADGLRAGALVSHAAIVRRPGRARSTTPRSPTRRRSSARTPRARRARSAATS